MTSRFSNPGSATTTAGFTVKDNDGSLIIAQAPIGRETVTTQHGEAEVAIVSKLHNVDTGEVFDDAWFFGKVMVPQLTTGADGDILGRIGKGEAQPGKSAPWTLEDPTDDDVLQAEAYMDALNSAEVPF